MPCACSVPFLFLQGMSKRVGLKKGRLGPMRTDIDFPSRDKQFSGLKVQLWPPALLSDVPRGSSRPGSASDIREDDAQRRFRPYFWHEERI